MFLGVWFLLGYFAVIDNLRYTCDASQFSCGQAAERCTERNTDISLGEYLLSVMSPSTEAHGFLHWSTLVGVRNGDLTELNSAQICIPQDALAC